MNGSTTVQTETFLCIHSVTGTCRWNRGECCHLIQTMISTDQELKVVCIGLMMAQRSKDLINAWLCMHYDTDHILAILSCTVSKYNYLSIDLLVIDTGCPRLWSNSNGSLWENKTLLATSKQKKKKKPYLLYTLVWKATICQTLSCVLTVELTLHLVANQSGKSIYKAKWLWNK